MTKLHMIFLALLLLTACGEGSGTVEVTIWGEEYIEEGIPSGEFEDGGSATYDKFLIAVAAVSLADTDGGEAGALATATVFDLVVPGPHVVGELADVSAVAHDDFGYRVAPVDASTAAHASVAAGDRQMMADMGYAIYVEGSFTSGGDTKTFAWGFSDATQYARCVDLSSGQEVSGVVVVDGGVADAELTIHGDHFFYDDLQSPNALLRTASLAAADADMDGEVTLAELDAVPLADIPSEQGPYGVGAGDVNDLGGYVRAATRTLGHFNGEGHCDVQ